MKLLPRPRQSTLAFTSIAIAASLASCGGSDDPFIPAKPPAFIPLASKLPATASEYDKHMQVVRLAWEGNNDITAPHWCANPGTGGNPLLADRSVVPITELFDGFYFTGTVSVGQYVMKTPDGGYILFDTMNNAADVGAITVPQLQAAGIDPAKLRAIVVTHGHADHDGGVPELRSRFNPPTIVVGSADYSAAKPYPATLQVDSSNVQPRPLTVAGLTLTSVPTPGHTPGTTSYIIPVTYKGTTRKIAYWGGSAFPATAAGAVQYMRGAEVMYEQIRLQQVDASINSHAFEDKSLDRIRAIAQQGGIGTSNPMIQGTSKIQLGFATLRSCSAAQLANRDATARNPVWRPTKVEFHAAGFGGTGMVVAARVSNYFQVVTGGSVKFTAANGATCTATSNAEGIATCTISSALPGNVLAEFDGKSDAPEGVDLASSASRSVL